MTIKSRSLSPGSLTREIKRPACVLKLNAGILASLLSGLLLSGLPLTSVHAHYDSGIYVPSPDERGWQDVWRDANRTRVKKHDPAYQEGKSIFLGTGHRPNFNYCLPTTPIVDSDSNTTTELRPLNRKTLKTFRRLSVGLFANQLFDCDHPERKVLNQLTKEDAGLVIYYLNREYQLRLTQPDGPGEKAKRFSQTRPQ